jgi:hypothetical protein
MMSKTPKFEIGSWVMDAEDEIGLVVNGPRFGKYLVEFDKTELLPARTSWIQARALVQVRDPRPTSQAQRELDEYLSEDDE